MLRLDGFRYPRREITFAQHFEDGRQIWLQLAVVAVPRRSEIESAVRAILHRARPRDERVPLRKASEPLISVTLVTPFETRGDRLNNIKREEMRVSSGAAFDTPAAGPNVVQT